MNYIADDRKDPAYTMLLVVLKILEILFVLFIFVVALGPLLWVFLSSFKSNTQILSNALSLPESLSFKNYSMAFKLAPITKFYGNSVIVAVCATLLNVVAVSMSSYVLARFKFRMRNFLKILFGLALLIPAAAIMQPLYLNMKALGFYDTLTGLIICYAAFSIPVSMYVMMSYYLTIPRELEEAAVIDGAGFNTTFWKIIFPLANPAMATCGVLAFIGAWNEFQIAMILTSRTSKRTLPIALLYFKSQFASDYGAMFAATMVVVIPSIVVFILLQKQVVSGLVAGAVKG
ncbi:ABC-type sugar transport system, permease component [Sphaerochaeta pleomorpha str. Grapes]|uniref:ABC-type sugar transport system, permease component n=1 Tax=Sphaerochaeta pleomorpha (strain ATCC BAA-1885 / DSM 22778 / Grapes) TaxID=158190 RepID=G8QTF1_SPHPG|nr:carbohydrate ABC transporter permease [Sphaerochaeta pleomorpha]AEV30192.1 ABC-type sugar transport system, permease component [Sphaerochaeta pleomorpha str. Grapes]